MGNTELTSQLMLYGLATLVAAILVWLNVFQDADVIRVGNREELIGKFNPPLLYPSLRPPDSQADQPSIYCRCSSNYPNSRIRLQRYNPQQPSLPRCLYAFTVDRPGLYSRAGVFDL